MRRSLPVILVALLAVPVAADRHASAVETMPLADGPLPGSPQILIKTRTSARYCGGFGVSATIKKSKKMPALDPDLGVVFALRFPSGLDFSPTHDAKRKASMKKFDAWYSATEQASRTAAQHYRAVLADKAAAPADQVAAAARMVQIVRWSASVLGHAEIPKNLTKYPEAVDAFCSVLRDKADPLGALAIDAASTCRDVAATAKVGAGWWDDVCKP